ncbi:hypothetical protein KM918_00910 [Priestia megaterium]|uniref:hypothetical protein n=1 Tax=Priestia megaterium TaxID=1404 RepID=UPI001C226FAC|nr:hypothetical protein [Priestia megaterium]MBU8685902.1 hypothetical protein [Priestia megaterium]
MIGVQGEDSCRKSGTGETRKERKRRGGSLAARGKPCTEINCGVLNDPYWPLYPFVRL